MTNGVSTCQSTLKRSLCSGMRRALVALVGELSPSQKVTSCISGQLCRCGPKAMGGTSWFACVPLVWYPLVSHNAPPSSSCVLRVKLPPHPTLILHSYDVSPLAPIRIVPVRFLFQSTRTHLVDRFTCYIGSVLSFTPTLLPFSSKLALMKLLLHLPFLLFMLHWFPHLVI